MFCFGNEYFQYLFGNLIDGYNNFYKLMKNIALILLVALFITAQSANTVDLVGPVTQTAFGCLKQLGYTNVIIRASSIKNIGAIDPNAVSTL